ncbi:MAG: M23 family metallopeptidase [Gemmiger sp.]|nr:M23 family metallopeptidase [Gemmiger sp.]
MKKLLLWVLMVALFAALLVGGTGWALYATTGEAKLPAGQPSLGDTPLEPVGYDWQVPVLGDVLAKPFYQAPNLTVQKVGAVWDTAPALTLPDWVTKSELTLTAPDGTTALAGTAEDFAGYTYTQNGQYSLTLTLWQQTDPVASNAQGWCRYQASYTLGLNPQITLSAERASQGDVVALLITGFLGDANTQPQADTDLGTITFHTVEGGWLGYIPISYNAESGAHTIGLTLGAQTLDATLTVAKKDVPSATTAAEAEIPGAAEEYRNAIWPLYTPGKLEKLWSGTFAPPTQNGARIPYGAALMVDGQRNGTATGITYYSTPDAAVTATQAGVVVYAGSLGLTGGTVVIDHGCGVKSYLFGLETVSAQSGQTLSKGDAVGTLGAAHALIWELRIGSKSVNPAGAVAAGGGLQYKENLG